MNKFDWIGREKIPAMVLPIKLFQELLHHIAVHLLRTDWRLSNPTSDRYQIRMRRTKVPVFVSLWAALLSVCLHGFNAAAESCPREAASVGPSAPPSLSRKAPPEAYQCNRTAIYRGKVIPVDSNVGQDGEGLRAILKTVPESVVELDTYQRNRRRVQASAYIATLGVVTGLASWIIGSNMRDENGVRTNSGRSIRNIGAITGVAIAGTSAIFAFSVLHTNEAHLGQAVQLHNRGKPEDQIQLQFTTGVDFP